MRLPPTSPMREQYDRAKRALARCSRLQHHHDWPEREWRQRMLWHKAWVRELEGQWRAYKHDESIGKARTL